MSTIQHMVKTTVYLPEQLKARIADIARLEGRSEADLIRTALEQYADGRARPRPKLPLFDSGDPTWAQRDEEELLKGFGTD
jgi:Ribbon-helix-helix protein, copG family